MHRACEMCSTIQLTILAALVAACSPNDSGGNAIDAGGPVTPDAADPIGGCGNDGECTDGTQCCPIGNQDYCISVLVDQNNCGGCGNVCGRGR